MTLSDADHASMVEYLNAVLDGYKSGKISLAEARIDLAHAMVAAALGNEAEFKAYIRIPPDEKWTAC